MAGTCIVTDCNVEVGRGRRMCREHWRQVPGKLRSRLGWGAGPVTRITEDTWAHARSAVEAP